MAICLSRISIAPALRSSSLRIAALCWAESGPRVPLNSTAREDRRSRWSSTSGRVAHPAANARQPKTSAFPAPESTRNAQAARMGAHAFRPAGMLRARARGEHELRFAERWAAEFLRHRRPALALGDQHLYRPSFSSRFIKSTNHPQVGKPFFTRRFGIPSAQHTIRKINELGPELVALGEITLLRPFADFDAMLDALSVLVARFY